MRKGPRVHAYRYLRYWGLQMQSRTGDGWTPDSSTTWAPGCSARALGGWPFAAGGGYINNFDHGEYRHVSDPHSGAFVVIQVERCFIGLLPVAIGETSLDLPTHDWQRERRPNIYRELAWHLYVDERPIQEFKHKDLVPANNFTRALIEEELLDTLALEIGEINPGSIASRAINFVRKLRKARAARVAKRLDEKENSKKVAA